jgi:hypothetical protein
MAESHIPSLPLYPEGRPCKHSTARRVFDLFDNVQRHTLSLAGQPPVELVTEFSPLQRKLLKLLRLRPQEYGRRASRADQRD